MRDAAAMAADLLEWYDRNARDLPWRVGPAERRDGVQPDPYAVWLSEIMLQQTTVAAVRGHFERFLMLWPDVSQLAAAEDAERGDGDGGARDGVTVGRRGGLGEEPLGWGQLGAISSRSPSGASRRRPARFSVGPP